MKSASWAVALVFLTACSPETTPTIETPTTTAVPPSTAPAEATSTVAAPAAPPGRRSHSMVTLDGGRLLVVGGQTIAGNSRVWMGDAWIYHTLTAEWRAVGSISPRGQATLAADGTKAFLFGGYAGSTAVYGDVHRLDDSEWVHLEGGSPPPGRAGSVMAFDNESGRFVLFGGDEAPFDARLATGETWTFDGSRWDRQTPSRSPQHSSEGHPTLFELALVYHETADRMILLVGGDETWAYDTNTDTWEERTPPGLDADFMTAAAYHAGIDRVITYGGAPTGSSQETWAYDYSTDSWARIETAMTPGPLGDHAMAYDPVTDLVYLFGGSAELLSLDVPDPPSSALWAFDGADWVRLDN